MRIVDFFACLFLFLVQFQIGCGNSNSEDDYTDGGGDAGISNGTGELIWAQTAGGSGWDIGNGIATFEDGSFLVTGGFSDTAIFGDGQANATALTALGGADVFVAKYNPDGTLTWARRAGGLDDREEEGGDIAALPDGSALVTGYFRSTATFGSGEVNQIALTALGNEDIFVAKYNADGTLAWAKSAGGESDANFSVGLWEEGNSVAALADGSALVTGNIYGTATFGPGEVNETTLSGSRADIFVAKYNANGDLEWARSAECDSYNDSDTSVGSEYGMGIAALADGSALVTGFFQSTTTFGSGESNETALVSAGGWDIFIAKYNPEGALEWVRRAGGSSRYDYGRDIVALADGSFLVTGNFDGSAKFGEGEVNQTTLTAVGRSDVFVAKYDADGALEWAKRAGGGESDYYDYYEVGLESGHGIAALADGSVVIVGLFSGRAAFGPGEANQTVLETNGFEDIFVAKYSANGVLVWAKSAGSDRYDDGVGIAAQADGSALVTGYIKGMGTFGSGEENETNLTPAGNKDVFVAKYGP